MASNDDGMGVVAGLGGVIGAIYGIVQGFQAHGIGGALVGGFLGFLGGMLLGLLVVFALGLAVVGGVIYVIYWIISKLWDVGKP